MVRFVALHRDLCGIPIDPLGIHVLTPPGQLRAKYLWLWTRTCPCLVVVPITHIFSSVDRAVVMPSVAGTLTEHRSKARR